MKAPVRGQSFKDVQCPTFQLLNSLVFMLKVSPITNKLSGNFSEKDYLLNIFDHLKNRTQKKLQQLPLSNLAYQLLRPQQLPLTVVKTSYFQLKTLSNQHIYKNKSFSLELNSFPRAFFYGCSNLNQFLEGTSKYQRQYCVTGLGPEANLPNTARSKTCPL